MAVSGSYTRGLCNHARNHSGFTLLPTRVNSGPTSPPTTFPAAFCTAWQEAQNDSPYRLAPAVGSGAFSFLVTGVVSPARGVLFEIRKAEISRASGSLNLKFGMVAVTA